MRVLLVCIFFLGCGEHYTVPSKLPLSVDETIKQFNYCLKRLSSSSILRALENILLGPMLEELENFKSLVKTLQIRGKTVLDEAPDTPDAEEYAFDAEMHNIQEFMRYARTLHLHVLSTEYTDNMARSVVVYHNDQLLIQEQREFILEKNNSVWKIKEIRDPSANLNQT